MIIRTLGTAGEKYQKLLDSIKNLTPQPKETIVVLPEGYDLPEEQIGNETFYFSPKGMVIQRLYGIEKCKTRYALVCDDDIEFDEQFVNKLFKPIYDGVCSITAGPLYDILPRKGFSALIDAVKSGAVPSLFHRKNFVTILNSSGYSYKRKLKSGKLYYSQSLPWACFFASISDLKKIRLQDEIWLDKNGYAALDDQTMFYKAHLIGIKTCVVPEALYIHNDAQAATKTSSGAAYYSGGFNKAVFWHRFIYKEKRFLVNKIWSKLCLEYNYFMYCLNFFVSTKAGKMKADNYILYKSGFKDGKRYLQTDEYNSLPDYTIGEKC